MSVVGRYAPSPTGSLHVGNLRTALLAWAAARSGGGSLLLRIDDLDPQRSRGHWLDEQLADLTAIGIDWDGGPIRQSARLGDYDSAIGRLIDLGLVYECFCTRAEIREAASAPHGELPEGAYPGTCRDLSGAELAERRAGERPAALRVNAGAERIEFDDLAAGHCAGVVDDFVVRRNDGVPAYNLATTVDDAELGVTEVVRGADLLGSAPRQIWLAGRLRIAAPERWAHVALVRPADGERLAKRHGAVTLADLAERGIGAGEVAWRIAAALGIEPRDGSGAAALRDGFDESLLADPAFPGREELPYGQ